jgi:hypothetical protein
VTYRSAPDDLALHGVRVLGFPTAARVAERYGLDAADVEETLLDLEAVGLVRRSAFAGRSGWSMTALGAAEGERRLTTELDAAGARDVVTAVHRDFLPLNEGFGRACTDWQVRPTARDPLARNDHSDLRWDHHVLTRLRGYDADLAALCERLAAHLQRFAPYPALYTAALGRLPGGDHAWVDGPDRDSLHLLWLQFHEDLLATLGLRRGTDGA